MKEESGVGYEDAVDVKDGTASKKSYWAPGARVSTQFPRRPTHPLYANVINRQVVIITV